MRLPHNNQTFMRCMALLLMTAVAVLCMGFSNPTKAAALGTSGTAAEVVDIIIQKPGGWYTKPLRIPISVIPKNSDLNIAKIEVKTTQNGSWQNISDEMAVEISDNCTVYVQVTDRHGNVYTKNRYIGCFDRKAPTVRGKLEGTLVRIEANDDLSGVAYIYVNGYRFDDLVNDTLDVRLKEYNDNFEYVSIQAQDNAGNKSGVYQLKNPYYKESSKATSEKATEEKKEDSTSKAEATPPTSAKGSTTDAKPDGSGTTVASSSQGGGGTAEATAESGAEEAAHMQFVTISTKSGKIFYMIIDHSKESENVYLLTEVSENDLLNFVEDVETADDYPEFIGENEKTLPEPDNETTEQLPEDAETPQLEEVQQTNEPEQSEKKGSSGILIVVLVLLAAGVGAYYYLKIYKPKQELANADDFEDFEFEDLEESESGKDVPEWAEDMEDSMN